jgi:T5SS/PEP-CTERM-associated repeat protein
LTLGALSTGFGSLIITDPGSDLERLISAPPAPSKVVIGDAGFGSLLVENQASLFDPDSGSTEDVTIANQQGSLGTLTVTGGATADVHSLAVGVSGNGFLRVDQNGELTLHDGDLAVDGPAGQFSIQSGGTITGSDVKFGNTSGSHATAQVDGTGSTLFYGNKLEVGTGADAVASLSVTTGGAVKFKSPQGDTSIDDLDIGTNGGSGSVSVDGTDSTLKAETATVGILGSITASNGGTVDLAGSINVGSNIIAALRADTGAILVGGTNQNDAPGIYVGAFNSIRGYGLVSAATLSDFGFVIADGGILKIVAPVTGPEKPFEGGGQVQISANSTLELVLSCQVGATFVGNGATLRFDASASFQSADGTIGQIGGFQASDTIELADVTLNQPTQNPPFVGTHTTVNGHTTWTDPDLVVTDFNGGTHQYELLGNYTDPVVSVAVINGDSFITLSSGTYTEAVQSVTTQPTSGSVSAGEAVDISVVLSGATTVVGGTPTLALNDGGIAFYDAAHSTATSLVFDYTVGANDRTSNLAITAVNLNGATVQDPNGATPDFTGALQSLGLSVNGATPPVPNPPPPTGTTADMIARDSTSGSFEIYDIGGNALLAAGPLGQVGLDWQFVGLGGFNGLDTSDMVLRNSNTGAFEVYDISNNNLTGAGSLGAVGLNWQFGGFGDFSGKPGETDMILRNGSSGALEVYDIANNTLTSAFSMGAVGLDWAIAGFGDFSGNPNETDMIMRNSSSGALEVYDIANNALTSAFSMGAVGLDWQVAGFGNFSGNASETDMIMRNVHSGALEVYDIANNALTSAFSMGAVGLDWQVSGFGNFSGNPNETDMIMRNGNTGALEVYDIANNALTSAFSMGAVGLKWNVVGTAADPPPTSNASMDNSNQVAQLVQAMAGFNGSSGAIDGLNPGFVNADTSQQPLLTTPHA